MDSKGELRMASAARPSFSEHHEHGRCALAGVLMGGPMAKFIVISATAGFAVAESVDLVDYVREVYPEVTLGEIAAYVEEQAARADDGRKAAIAAFLKRTGSKNPERDPRASHVWRKSAEHEAYIRDFGVGWGQAAGELKRAGDGLAHQVMDTWRGGRREMLVASLMAQYKKDKILLEILGLKPPDES